MIKFTSCLILLLALTGGSTARAHPGLTVHFLEPDKYRDVNLSGSSTDRMRSHALSLLEEYLQQLADANLPAKQTLVIDIRDIDMAGEYEPWRAPMLNNTRFIRDQYPPRIKLHYLWRDQDGNVLAEKDETVTDITFLQLPDRRFLDNDSLRYEKTTLRRWFEKRFKVK